VLVESRLCVEQSGSSNPVSTATRKVLKSHSRMFSIGFWVQIQTVTDYLLEVPAMCPYCGREIREKTLVEPV
jgi:hypothetical protein